MVPKSEPAASGSQTDRAPDTSTTAQEGKRRSVKSRKGQFVIAPRRSPGMQMMGLSPLQFSAVEQALRDSPDIDIIDKVGPRDRKSTRLNSSHRT